jgi:hypothetical protein
MGAGSSAAIEGAGRTGQGSALPLALRALRI